MKIIGPLFSQKARGTFRDFLTFSYRKTGQQARYQKKQKDSQSPDQLAQREKFSKTSLACRFFNYGVAINGAAFFGLDSDFYNDKIKNKDLTKYNFCISDNIKNI